MDHFGPLSYIEGSGKRFALVMVDGFSHFVHCVAVESPDAESTAAELVKMSCFFGIPSFVHTDRGAAFTSDCLDQLCTILHISKQHSPVAFPRCNGLAEQTVGCIKSLLHTMRATDLDRCLPLCCLVHNSTPNSRTGTSPFEAAFGFTPKSLTEINSLSSLVDCSNRCSNRSVADVQFYVHQFFTREFHSLVRSEHLQDADNQSILESRFCAFAPGDLVVSTRRNAITGTRVDGPFVLLSRTGVNVWRMYKLEDDLSMSVCECPESLLKKFVINDIVNGFSIRPPVPQQTDCRNIEPKDFVIARNIGIPGPPSVSLFQVIANDIPNQSLVLKLWKPNRLMQFYQTEYNHIRPYSTVILSKLKLRNRTMSDGVRQLITTLLLAPGSIVPEEGL